MFGSHEKKNLSAYAHGELSPRESERVSRHLATCEKCRAEFEEIKLGVRFAECLPVATAPAPLWDGIESALDAAARRDKSAARPPRPAGRLLGWRPLYVAATSAFAVVALAAVWVYDGSTRPAWEVARLEGAPRIDSGRIGDKGRLGVGDWLETDSASRAQIEVANIGEVDVEPNTRVRLVTTRLTEHRLELARGTLHARIWAPPRLFFVNTPSAVAADLGCAYTLEVDDDGRSLLHVTSGWVALETEGAHDSLVPAGAACVTKPGKGPGTPFFEDAPAELVRALREFDFGGGGSAALDAVLANSRPRDTLTLWHLLPRTAAAERERVFERLASLSPPPGGVTREGALALDPFMLDAWKVALTDEWMTESMPKVKRAWRNIWK
ncbi:MAG TPA: zf-HC2 domain-containing protein [Pyrinomonadaceae bacterium]|nr:zf-HC2 domain-containing protein [Pyrinomonadaceae bacterium]